MWAKTKKYQPYLVIVIVSVLLLLPQIVNHAAIIGIDSIFHMNRFYDAAMQIKTGHFNYFQSFFGFMASGRIVNALYGAVFAYVNGALLLLTHTWVNYQLASSFLILVISGVLMYQLARQFKISQWSSLIVGLIYIVSAPTLSWVVGQQFTGWGAALLPLLLMNSADLIRGKVRPLKLAVGVVVLFQLHVLTALMGCLSILPFWISGVLEYPEQRKPIYHHTVKAILWTILLSANVWGAMLEVMGSNHLLSVAPATPLSDDGLRLVSSNSSVMLNPVNTVLFALLVLYVVCFWKTMARDFKVVFLTGFAFLIISTNLFPWDIMGHVFPMLNYYLQMPKRFDVISFVLLTLSVGLALRDRTPFSAFDKIKWSLAVLTLLGLSVTFVGTVINGVDSGWKSSDAIQNRSNVNFHEHSASKLRRDLNSKNLSIALFDITKSTPDYLPVKHSLAPNQYYPFHPYHTYGNNIVYNKLNHYHKRYQVQKRVQSDGIHFTWVNNTATTVKTAVPLIMYRHSIVTINGQHVNHVAHSKIGRLIINAKPGKNEVIMSYRSSWWFKLLLLLTLFSWIAIIAKGFYAKIKKD